MTTTLTTLSSTPQLKTIWEHRVYQTRSRDEGDEGDSEIGNSNNKDSNITFIRNFIVDKKRGDSSLIVDNPEYIARLTVGRQAGDKVLQLFPE